MATSKDVAAYFGKNHNEVIRKIWTLLSELPDGGVSTFAETTEINIQNKQTYRLFEMTRDGFTLLAMGFTGKKALQFKLA